MIRAVQQVLGVQGDGKAGPRTWGAGFQNAAANSGLGGLHLVE